MATAQGHACAALERRWSDLVRGRSENAGIADPLQAVAAGGCPKGRSSPNPGRVASMAGPPNGHQRRL